MNNRELFWLPKLQPYQKRILSALSLKLNKRGGKTVEMFHVLVAMARANRQLRIGMFDTARGCARRLRSYGFKCRASGTGVIGKDWAFTVCTLNEKTVAKTKPEA